MKAIAVMDEHELRQRREEFYYSIQPFTKWLTHIYTIMPSPGYVLRDGVWEPLQPLPEWQELIDKIIKMQKEYIKNNFPEFYKED